MFLLYKCRYIKCRYIYIYIYIHIFMYLHVKQIYIHKYVYLNITVQYSALHYIALHYTTLHHLSLQYALHYAFRCIASQYITSHFTTLRNLAWPCATWQYTIQHTLHTYVTCVIYVYTSMSTLDDRSMTASTLSVLHLLYELFTRMCFAV